MRLTQAFFAGLLGRDLTIDVEERAVPLRLATVEPLDQAAPTEGAFRLEFRGPTEPVIAQGTYDFAVDADRFAIFFVPIGRDATGVVYEAVFN